MACPQIFQPYPSFVDRVRFVLVVDRGIEPVCWDGSEKQRVKTKGRNERTTRTTRSKYGSHKRIYPQYIDVPAKIASTGCILSCHCILSKLACQAYFHVPAIAGIDRF